MKFMERVFETQKTKFDKQVVEQNRGYEIPTGIEIQRDLEYGKDKNQTYDIIAPVKHSDKTPIVINIHGGGLVMGDKDFNTRFNIKFAQNGYLVISVNYRLVPEVTMFDQLEDISNALTFIRKYQEREDGRITPTYITADSAGALLALYTLAIKNDEEVSKRFYVAAPTIDIKAAAFISGMFFTTKPDKIGLFMPKYLYGKNYKKKDFYPLLNPTNERIVKTLPPTMFVTSKNDMLNNYTTDMYKAAQAHEMNCELLDYYQNNQLTHAFSVFNPSLNESVEVINEICEYFESYQ